MIRGDPSEDAVLCTDDKTFELRIADTSNALLITPTLILPKDAGKSRTIIMLGEREESGFFSINSQYSLCMDMPGPLAQSAERRADNAKVVSSSLTWTIEFFSPYRLCKRTFCESCSLSLAFSF